jgi:hypothetical protein
LIFLPNPVFLKDLGVYKLTQKLFHFIHLVRIFLPLPENDDFQVISDRTGGLTDRSVGEGGGGLSNRAMTGGERYYSLSDMSMGEGLEAIQ